MPQLIASRSTFPRFVRSRRGSALVGVVSLATIMAITSVGLLQVAGTAVNNEIASLEETRAFWAAESGLQLAAQSVRLALPTGDTLFGPLTIDGFTVIDSVLDVQPIANSATIRAIAFNSDAIFDNTTFLKAVRAIVTRNGTDVSISGWAQEDTLH
jgi:hypothetical protein